MQHNIFTTNGYVPGPDKISLVPLRYPRAWRKRPWAVRESKRFCPKKRIKALWRASGSSQSLKQFAAGDPLGQEWLSNKRS
jgi:hypothetical protein